jgi:hypothetical protein
MDVASIGRSDCWYSVDEDDVREFVAFLRESGGFEIN